MAGLERLERVTPRFALEHSLAGLPHDAHSQLSHGLARVNAGDLGFRGNRVADVNRRSKLPVLTQKHAARTGEIHGDERVQKPSRQPALYHQPLKFRRCGKMIIEMQRVVVSCKRRKCRDVIACEGQASPCPLANSYPGVHDDSLRRSGLKASTFASGNYFDRGASAFAKASADRRSAPTRGPLIPPTRYRMPPGR